MCRYLILVTALLAMVTACDDRSPQAATDPVPPPAGTVPPQSQHAPAPASAMAELKATPGNGVSGTLTLTPASDGVRITGSIKGLMPATTHGFHVHEKGDCSAPDASSAGAHYNPAGQAHGDPLSNDRHLGDLPNIVSDTAGVAELDVIARGATLRSGQSNDILGRALIVHAKADDYRTQPSGDSGSRIACAIIK